MSTRRFGLRFLPWLFAVALLAAQSLAFAHELQHDLQSHTDSSCVLHLHVKHAGHGGVPATPVLAVAANLGLPAAGSDDAASAPVLGYRTRAPPARSSRSS